MKRLLVFLGTLSALSICTTTIQATWMQREPASSADPQLWSQSRSARMIFPAPRGPRTVRIDAQLQEWRDRPFLPLGLLAQTGFGKNWEGREDLAAKVYAGWDESSLYLAGEVADQAIRTEAPAFHLNDSVEIKLIPQLPPDPSRDPSGTLEPSRVRPLHFYLLPSGDQAGVREANTDALLPGVKAAYRIKTGGYQWELGIPWKEVERYAIPPPQEPLRWPPKSSRLGFQIQVHDCDEEGQRKGSIRFGSLVRSPESPFASRDTSPQPFPPFPSPERMELIEELTPENLATYLPALIVVGTEQDFILAGEEADLIALMGLPPAYQGATLKLQVVDQQGVPYSLAAGTRWSSPLFKGWKWRWQPPSPFEESFLLRATLVAPGVSPHACWGLMRSAGEVFQGLQKRRETLSRELEEMERHPDPTGAQAASRYAPSLWIQLKVLGERYRRLPTWSIRWNLASFRKELDQMEERWALLRAGRDPLAEARGTILKAYRSDLDDTIQPYSVHIPNDYGVRPPPPPSSYEDPFRFPQTPPTPQYGEPGYPPLDPGSGSPAGNEGRNGPDGETGGKDTPWPLLVELHGYGNGWRPAADPAPGFIVLAPQGRGNGDYRLWCQMDVLRTIEEVKRDYRIDENRVYLTGGSMGGTGAWFLAVHYPDLFAALAPICGNTDHHVWEEVWGWGQKRRTRLTDLRNYLEDIEDSSFFAENLLHVPSYCIHGDADDIVPVGHSRAITRRLADLGYEYVYEEKPGVGHSVGGSHRVRPWLWEKKRDPFPRRVVFKTAKLRHKGAYWVEILRFAELLRPALIEAQIQENNHIQVQTDNIARYALTLSEHLVDLRRPVTISTNGQPTFSGPVPQGQRLVLVQTASGRWERESLSRAQPGSRRPHRLEKKASLEGPIEHAFMSRFLLVYGTIGEDERENETNFLMADELAEKWVRWANARARMKADVEVTEQDLAESNLILYGGPASNRITAQINRYLPLRIEGSEVVLGRRRFRGHDVGIKMCYPNPLNPDRYVCVFAGVNWRGTYGINGRFGNWFDWGIFDDRNWFDFGVFDNRTHDPEGWLAVGFFDQDWQINEKYLFYGDESVRAAARPFRPPEKTAAEVAPEEIVYLSDLRPQAVHMEKGTLRFDQSFAGLPLKLGNQIYERGLGVHPQAELVYDLGGHFRTFEAYVGAALNPEGEKSGPARAEADQVEYEVYGDDRLLASTGTMGLHDPPQHLYVPIEGVQELKLVSARRDSRKWLFGDANWALARLEGPLQARVDPPFTGGYETFSLDGEWLLESLDLGQGVEQSVYQPGPYLPRNQTILVPGTVQARLMEIGRLPDLYRDKNFEQAAWVESQEWWHYRTFRIPQSWRGRAIQLVLQGVNYQADVWLNGRSVGGLTGMFQEGKFEVARLLHYDSENFLAVRVVAAPVAWTQHFAEFQLLPREEALTSALGYGYGGAPRLMPLGLWRSVSLRATGPARLGPLTVITKGLDSSGTATISVAVEITSCTEEPLELVWKGEISRADLAPDTIAFSRRVRLEPSGQRRVRVEESLPQARLWWPQGKGNQPLYRLETCLEIPGGLVSDRAGTNFGVRLPPSLPGEESWASSGPPNKALPASSRASPTLHGQPWNLRSGVWVPPDALLRLDAVDYEHLLRLAQECGLNTLWVWGGGLPERDLFYDLCDQKGIGVIQEFPLVEADYSRLPREPFLQAARQLIQRLRNHPCLLLWVGGSRLDLSLEGNRSLVDELAQVVAEEDPSRPFLSSELETTGGSSAGNGGVPEFPSPSFPRFPGTWNHIGNLTAPPTWGSLELFMTAEKIWPRSEVWAAHGSRPQDEERLVADYGPAENGPEEVRKAHLLQATAYQQEIEATLAASFRSSAGPPGFPLFPCLWQFNESWPAISPGLVDWYGIPRPSYYAAKRAWQPQTFFAVLSRDRWRAGETITAELYARTEEPKVIRARLLKLDQTVLKETEIPVSPTPLKQVGRWEWQSPAYSEDVLLLLHLTLAPPATPHPRRSATPTQHRFYWFSVTRFSNPPTHMQVLWRAQETASLRGLWEHLRRNGVEITHWDPGAPSPLGDDNRQLDGYDVYVLGPGNSGSAPLTSTEQRALVEAVRGGAGLLLDGWAEGWDRAPLGEVLPFYSTWTASEEESTPQNPTFLAPDHPVLAGLDPEQMPACLQGSPFSLRFGSTALMELAPGHPLLVEGEYGQGRVLAFLFPPSYARLLTSWSDRETFYAGALGYLSKLPYQAFRDLLRTPTFHPFSDLDTLPTVTPDLTVDPQSVTVRPGSPQTIPVTVENPTRHPVLMALLELRHLSPPVRAYFSDNAFPLAGGEGRTVEVTFYLPHRASGTQKVECLLTGWKLEETSVDLEVHLEE